MKRLPPPKREIATETPRGTKRGAQIYVMRVSGSPSREEVQEYARQTGDELVGAYKIYGGIPSKTGIGSVDGVEFVFKSKRHPNTLAGKNASVSIYTGVDLTEWYQSNS